MRPISLTFANTGQGQKHCPVQIQRLGSKSEEHFEEHKDIFEQSKFYRGAVGWHFGGSKSFSQHCAPVGTNQM